MPPIVAYHVIFSTYGFWLPNDPRGSGSSAVWSKNLRRFGPPTRVETRHSVAAVAHARRQRLAAKAALQREAVRLTGLQAVPVADGFAEIAHRTEARVFAAAIMPDHVHFVIARGEHRAEDWAGSFKRAASRALRAAGRHPFAAEADAKGRLPSVWADGGWKVYLHDDAEILRAVEYVRQNPLRAGLREQNWSFVTPYASPRGRGG